MENLGEQLLAGDKRALARAITAIESGAPTAREIMRTIYPHTGKAQLVGVTGAPGTGKSTLTNRLIKYYRAQERRVGVVCVDPTSSLTGGAVLGDRIRLSSLYADPGVFMRSMATRGNMGGLARTTNDVLRLLDAFGMDIIIVETVGVGQDELDIARTAHTTLLVQVPGLGDDIQAIKAGILEIADIFVINKADQPGADRLENELRVMLNLGANQRRRPPICRTVASKGEGIEALGVEISNHYTYLQQSGLLLTREKEMLRAEIVAAVRDQAELRARHALEGDQNALLDRLVGREIDIIEAIDLLRQKLF